MKLDLGDHVFVMRYTRGLLGLPLFSHDGIVTGLNPLRITHFTREQGLIIDDPDIPGFIETQNPAANPGTTIYKTFLLSRDPVSMPDVRRRIDTFRPEWNVYGEPFNCETAIIYLRSGKIRPPEFAHRYQMVAVLLLLLLMVVSALMLYVSINRKSRIQIGGPPP